MGGRAAGFLGLCLASLLSGLSGCSGESSDAPNVEGGEDDLMRARTLSCEPSGDACAKAGELGYCVGAIKATAKAQGTSPGLATITIERREKSGRALEALVVTDREAHATDTLFSADWDDGQSYLSHSKRISRWTSRLAIREHELDVRCEYASRIEYRDPCADRSCPTGQVCEVRGRGNPKAYCVPKTN